jgi:hypothetical protein
MNPNDNQNVTPQGPTPQPNGPGSDWQRQAMNGAGVNPANPQQPIAPQLGAPAGNPLPSMPAGQPDAPVPPPGRVFVSGELEAGPPPRLTPTPGGKKKLTVVILAVILLALIAGALYFFLRPEQKSAKDATEASKKTATATAKDMAALKSVAFVAPALNAYHKDAAQSNDTFTTYLTEDENCSIGYGTVTATQVPGTTAEEAVDSQVKKFLDEGAEVDGPDAGQALVLKDADDPSVTYKMPTLTFKLAKEKTRVTTYYSIVILKNDERAVVSLLCANKTGEEIPESKLAPLVTAAKQLTVDSSPTPATTTE